MEKKRVNEIRVSDHVQEILKSMPHWFLMSGNIILFCFIGILLVLSWFVRYPDIIVSDIILVSESPPIGHYSRSSGKIKFFLKDGDFVSKDQTIALIENSANYSDVKKLETKLNHFSIDSILPKRLEFRQDYKLGEIQNEYLNFIEAVNDYENNIRLNPLYHEVKGFENRITQTNRLLKKQRGKKANYEKDYEIMGNSFKRSQKLYEKGVIALAELESSERNYLALERLLRDSEIEIDGSLLRVSELKQRILEIKTGINLGDKIIIENLVETTRRLEEALLSWNLKYLIKSSINGRLALFDYWSNDQFVEEGKEVAVVVPNSENIIQGKALMPLANSGKVEKGQEVIVKVENYNYVEFGVLIGKVNSVSSIPRNNKYLVNIIFPKGFTTSYNKTLQFDQEISGKAEIITDDIRLFERFFYQFKNIFKRYA